LAFLELQIVGTAVAKSSCNYIDGEPYAEVTNILYVRMYNCSKGYSHVGETATQHSSVASYG
jgi:hypothetical protein